jgi:hypothetical protein
MIELRPYDDLAAMAVLSRLDASDRMEAEVMRGAITNHLALFAEWRSMQPAAVLSLVASVAGQPFALLMLVNTGQHGVASAALLARDHARYRRPLAQFAAAIRRDMPRYCADRGIHRIEARAWDDHPTASSLLAVLGFKHEANMPGFGPRGTVTFRQFAWLTPSRPADPV